MFPKWGKLHFQGVVLNALTYFAGMFDPAPITRFLRARASSQLLVVAVHHLQIFEALAATSRSIADLMKITGLKERAAMVLFPALCAMDLLRHDDKGNLSITELGKFLTHGAHGSLVGYTGLDKDDPGVLQMRDFLLNDGPENQGAGLSYVMEGDVPSPMDEPAAARFFTTALAGRARYLSPLVAAAMPGDKKHLLDIAGGTGYYTFEWLMLNPVATATIIDRPEVLAVAKELLQGWIKLHPQHKHISTRITWMDSDMLTVDFPRADLILAASMFHDWPAETCLMLAQKIGKALHPGGEVWIHDAFLNDTMDGPLAVTDYSAILFLATKGRCYSRAEMREWLAQAGLINNDVTIPTLLDYALIYAKKS